MFEGDLFEMRELLESAETFIDLIRCQPIDARGAKLFNVEGSHYRTEDHCPPHPSVIDLFLAGEITHEAAGKGVASSSRIKNRLEWISRNGKVAFIRKQGRAVLATLDNQGLRSPGQNRLRGFDHIGDSG